MARFQSFEIPDHRTAVPARLAALRAKLPELDAEALLIPRSDAYLGEFVAPSDERLAWATGFTGSAGLCLLLPDRAILFLDGRYLEQGRAQTDASQFEIGNVHRSTPVAWIKEHLQDGMPIAADPWLHSINFLRRLKRAGAQVLRVDSNPIDELWQDRPEAPSAPVRALPPGLAGESSNAKRHRLAATLRARGMAGALIASPDSVCWLFNIRGGDTPHTPLVQARAVLRSDGEATLLVEPSRIGETVREHLGDGVRLAPPADLGSALASFAGKSLAVDPDAAPDSLRLLAEARGAVPADSPDPAAVPKALKNQAELEGMREAHRLDGAAMAAFLCWLDRCWPEDGLTEIEAVEALERHRIASGALHGIAFDTISASGPNAALPHYRVSRTSNRRLRRGEFLLVDSGGQFRTGTTDITRTIALGTVPEEARTAYTLVLRAMIRLSTLEFPDYATGMALDGITREILWRNGLDYAHGTGHGVGAGLSVHEGPFSISPRGPGGARPLQPGLVLSNEPGLYVPGSYGVRIENLLACKAAAPAEGGHPARLAFETLTLAPIDLRPLRPELLEHSERLWLDSYHARVWEEIGPLAGPETRQWLRRACRPLDSRESA